MFQKTFAEVSINEFFIFDCTMKFLDGTPITSTDWNMKIPEEVLPCGNHTPAMSNCIYHGGQPDFVADDAIVWVADSPEDEATYPELFYYD